eukprot:350528-Chlamydomonas_euryale.AAC.3
MMPHASLCIRSNALAVAPDPAEPCDTRLPAPRPGIPGRVAAAGGNVPVGACTATGTAIAGTEDACTAIGGDAAGAAAAMAG